MVTSFEAAKEERAKAAGAAPAFVPPHGTYVPATHPVMAPHVSSKNGVPLGLDPQDFVKANRINIKDGSLFIDPYLVIHPRELAPANDAALRQKLQLTYSINNPNFFDAPERRTIALNLGRLIPISTEAKRSKLLGDVQAFNHELETGTDTALAHELDDKKNPFAAIVRDVTQRPGSDPVGLEALKNSLAVYLLVREKLTQNGYLNKLNDYVLRNNTPDQVLADLADKIGVTPLAVREAALKGGIDGVGALLGLSPRYVADVKALTEYAATQDFGYNLVEHWHLGRQLQGLEAPIAEKIITGMDARITAKIAEYRNRIHNHFEVPTPVAKEEQRIAAALSFVDPIERTLLYKLGYEICYSPEVLADDIAFHKNVYGLHRKAANDLSDVQGTYRIYFSGHGDEKGAMRTLAHEVAHNLWPTEFSAAEVQKIDQLANADQARFGRFQKLMDEHYDHFERLFNAYKVGNVQEKDAVIATANEQFAAYGLQADALFPYLREAHDFQFAVKHVFDTLREEGDRYNRSGYNSPQERFREVISRFAELKQVEYRGEPQFIQFLAPGLNEIWENHYLPHLARVSKAIDTGALPAVHPHTITRPAADEQPQVEDHPKVEQRPGTPEQTEAKHPAPTNPPINSEADQAPSSTVSTNSLQLTGPVVAALDTLQAMGVQY